MLTELWSDLRYRARALLRRDAVEHELNEELQFHIEKEAEKYERAGVPREEALRRARLALGGVEPTREATRDAHGMTWLETLVHDARYAARALRRQPSFAVAVVMTLAVGIGASTAIFSMVDGVLLRGLPFGNGDRLVHITQSSIKSDDAGESVMEVRDLGQQMHTLSAVAEYHSMYFQLYGHGDPLRVQTGVVSDRFFTMLGIKPILGRTFLPGEEAIGAPPVVVLSHRFWMDEFHGDSSVVGTTFTMNDKQHTVVGVLPALPGYPDDNDIWMPAGACPFRSAPRMMNDRAMRMVEAFGVLAPGATLDQARTELAAVQARFHAAYPAAYPAAERFRFSMDFSRDEMTARAKPILYMLLAAAAFLLLAAIANAANLSLSRQMRRNRELALRVALGAGQLRLYRQLAVESLLLAFGGCVLGVAFAASGVGVLRSTAARFTPRAGDIHMDGAAVLFAIGLAVVIALAVAAAPFVHLLRKRDVADALRQGNSGAMGSTGDLRVRSSLVVAQVAIAFVMLVGAGLLTRSLIALERVDAGVDVSRVLTARVSLNFSKYKTRASVQQMIDALLPRLAAMPGVASAGIATSMPLADGTPNVVSFSIENRPTAPGARGPHSDVTAVSPDYFRTVGIPLLGGRTFTLGDRDTVNAPAILSARVARTYWGRRNPIGSRITPDSGKTWFTVVGIVGDTHQGLLTDSVTDEIYIPALAFAGNGLGVFLRTVGPTAPMAQALRSAVASIDPLQAVSEIEPLSQVRGAQLAEPRLTTTLLATFASFALLLTGTGLAGVIAYSVTQRLAEIAIRMALGATAARVLALVMRQGVAIVVVGVVIGAVLAYETSKLATALLFHVTPTDASTYAGVAALLLATATAACWAPAMRALRADPAQVFRAG